MRFEWNEAKARSNFAKHGVSFQEASTVFGDPLSVSASDAARSREEDRFVTIGVSSVLNTVVVAHTDRGDSIRIISARRATAKL